VADSSHRLLQPSLGLACAAAVAVALLAVDQLAENMPGAWFEILAAAVLLLAALAMARFLARAWRRHREGLDRRGALWVGGAVGALLVGVVAALGLFENAQIASVISGADVHLTRPVIEALPRPPGTKLLDETPGLADTESISEDFTATKLSTIVPFYESHLRSDGWVEDTTSAGTSIVRFTRGEYVLSVAIDPPSSGYTLTVDRIAASPAATPSAS
jgi:DNA-binding transcriptional regulator of glucitol operon